MSLIIKNVTGAVVPIDSLGVDVGPGEAVDLLGLFNLNDIMHSASGELIAKILAGSIVINDGSADLDQPSSLQFVENRDQQASGDTADTTVSSVFGRAGNVSSQAGDYSADQIHETAARVWLSPAEKSKLAGIEAGASNQDASEVPFSPVSGLTSNNVQDAIQETRDEAYTKTALDGGQLDNRYFREDEHIEATSGSADSSKPVSANSSGRIDNSFINLTRYSQDYSTETSTTSPIYTPLIGIAVTPIAGTYIISFSSSGNGTNRTAEMKYAIFVGGSVISHTERDFLFANHNQGKAIRLPMHSQAMLSLNGSQSVEVRYKTSAGTFHARGRSLILLRVGPE